MKKFGWFDKLFYLEAIYIFLRPLTKIFTKELYNIIGLLKNMGKSKYKGLLSLSYRIG